jgi:hypothetical protein
MNALLAFLLSVGAVCFPTRLSRSGMWFLASRSNHVWRR